MALHARSAEARAAAKTDYGTPREVYERLDADFGPFTIDLAAHAGNATHPRYLSQVEDSLSVSWDGETGYLNPPYGRGIDAWLRKARSAAMYGRALVVQLIPANVGSAWWRRYIMGTAEDAGRLLSSRWVPETQVLWLRWEGLITGVHVWPQRITFEGAPDGAMFDNAAVVHASPNRRPPKGSTRPGSLAWGWPR